MNDAVLNDVHSNDQSDGLVLSGNGLTVTVAPRGGARIAQLSDAAGRNWLVQTDRQEPDVRDPVDFVDGTRGGWDECLPSVSACENPNRDGGHVADHGNFWFRPWRVIDRSDNHAVLGAPDFGQPLQVQKTIQLLSERPMCAVTIEIHNSTDSDYRLVYSAHPLWRWQHDAIIELPGAGEVRTAFGPRWPDVRSGIWPELDEKDLSLVSRMGIAENYKVFVRWGGRARLSFAGQPRALLLTQSTDVTPWLGVCVNRDRWPPAEPGESWIALEPTTSPTDLLTQALAAGNELRLPAKGSTRWTSTVEIESVGARG